MAITAHKYWSGCLGCLILSAAHIAIGQDALNEFMPAPFRERSQPVRLNELDDPMPPQARFQFGTERFVSRRPVFDMALSPDGKTLLTRDSENIHCWDAATGKIRWTADVDAQWNASYGLRAFAFTGNSEFFFSQSGPETLVKWIVSTGKPISIPVKNALPLLPENRPVNSFPGATLAIDVNQDGSRIAAAGGHGIVVYDAAGNSLLEIPNKPNLAVAPEDWKQDQLLFGGHYSLAMFSPNGNMLSVVTSDTPQRVRLLDAATGEVRCVIELDSRLVRMAFAPDGNSLVTTVRNGTVSQFSTATGQLTWQRLVEPAINLPDAAAAAEDSSSAVAYSPAGKLVAAAVSQFGQELIFILDASNGMVRSELSGHTLKPWAIAFTADSSTLYSTGLDRIIRRWDLLKAEERPLEKGFHGSGIVATTRQDNRIALGDSLGNIHLSDTTKRIEREIHNQKSVIKTQGGAVSALAFAHDGQLMASGCCVKDELTVTVWNTSTSDVVHRWQWPERGNRTSKVGTLEFSSDGTRLAVAAFGRGRAYLLNVTEGKQVAELEHELICGLSFDRSGNQLVTAGANEQLCFWDSATGKLMSTKEIIGGDLQNVRCSPVDDLIVTAHFPNVLRVWNAKDMTLRKRAPLSGEANFEALAFSSDGNWFATGSSGDVNIIHTRSAELSWRAGSHRGRVSTVGFTEQDKVLVSGGSDGMVYCWELMPEEVGGAPDYDKLWSALRDGSDAEAEKLQWELVQIGDPAVAEVARRLIPITRVLNLRAISKGIDRETAESRVRLAMQLCEKNPTVEIDIRLRRAVDFLATLSNPQSIALLKQLAAAHACKDVRKEAMFALETIQ